VKDIETHNLNRLMKKLPFPSWLRWKWLRVSSRDNARTPFQWDAGPGAGFSGATPWLGINGNHRLLNYAAQQNDPDSVLSFYKKMIRFRAGSDVLKYGEFRPLFAKGPIIAYERRSVGLTPAGQPAGPAGGERIVALLNFSGKQAKLPGIFAGEIAVSNTGRRDLPAKTLEPWEAVVIRIV
jgi:glycosidase